MLTQPPNCPAPSSHGSVGHDRTSLLNSKDLPADTTGQPQSVHTLMGQNQVRPMTRPPWIGLVQGRLTNAQLGLGSGSLEAGLILWALCHVPWAIPVFGRKHCLATIREQQCHDVFGGCTSSSITWIPGPKAYFPFPRNFCKKMLMFYVTDETLLCRYNWANKLGHLALRFFMIHSELASSVIDDLRHSAFFILIIYEH